jgi:hypothetical protein
MKLVYTTSANKKKLIAISKYPGISKYFDEIESKIIEAPTNARQEKLFIDGKQDIVTYRRHIKTMFFHGMLPDSYLFLTLNYAITTDDIILVLEVSVHDYIN